MKTIFLPLLAASCLVTGFGFSAGSAPVNSRSAEIDKLLEQSWKKNGVQGNPMASEEVFLRRAYLTVVGRIPTFEEAQEYLASKDSARRSKLVDRLLASDGYSQHFFNYWADILRAQSQGVGGSTTAQNYLEFIRESLRTNKPYDQFARELVSGRGTCFENGAIGYYMRDNNMPLDNLSNTIRIFLGTRLECAQCHDHPFDRWKQMDFYKMAAFTHNMSGSGYQSDSQTEVNKLIREDKKLDAETRDMMRRAISEITTPLRSTRVNEGKSSLRLPHDYKYSDAKPKDVVQAGVMFGKPVALSKESDPSVEFARWMTSAENPRFAQVIANRLWKKVFGLGLIEPLDELMDNSVAVNPELMSYLEKQMKDMRYDMKAFLRVLLNTQAFSRASTPAEISPAAPYFFTGPVFRRMSAEQIWDSLVTLVNPNPDQENWSLREREKRESENRDKLAQLLDMTEAPLLYEAAMKSAVAMREQNKEFDLLRKELDEARAKDDKEKAKEIQRRLGESQRVFRQTVSKSFYEAAAKSGNKKIQTALASASQSMGGPMEMAVMNMMDTPRVDPKDMPMSAGEMRDMDVEMVALKINDPKSRKSYVSYRRSLHQTWCRASELPSPAPRGHFLREFGQSDRETIENANEDASVPQALTIMNGSLAQQLTSTWSALSVNLRRCASSPERVDALFLSLFSRKPGASERAIILNALDQAAGSSTVWEDFILAAVSTNQFLFIE